MKRSPIAAPLSRTTPMLLGMAIPVAYVISAGSGGTASLVALVRTVLHAPAAAHYLFAVAAALAAAS